MFLAFVHVACLQWHLEQDRRERTVGPIAQICRSTVWVFIFMCAGFAPNSSTQASEEETHVAALISYLEDGKDPLPEQTVIAQATADTVKAISRLLSRKPEEDVQQRCLETLAIVLRSHEADVALASRNLLLSRAEAGDRYAVRVVERLDRHAQPLLKKVNEFDIILDFGNEYASLKDLHSLRMLRDNDSLKALRDHARDEKRCFGPKVRILNVHSASFSDKDLWIVDRFDYLGSMELAESGVCGSGLRDGRWPHLKILHLDGCPVTDKTISLVHLPSLELVSLFETQIGKQGLRQLNLNQPGIKELWVSSPHLKGSDLSVLQEYRHLVHLRLRSSIIDSDAIDALSGCRELRLITVYVIGDVQTDLLASLKRSVGSTEVSIIKKKVGESPERPPSDAQQNGGQGGG